MDFKKEAIHHLADARIANIYAENHEFVILDALISKQPDGSWPSEMLDNWLMQTTHIMINVAEKVSVYISEYNAEYSFRLMYEYHMYHELRDKKLTSADSERFAKEAGMQHRINELVASEVADRLKSKEKAVFQMISVVQTRLSNLRQERGYTKHQ